LNAQELDALATETAVGIIRDMRPVLAHPAELERVVKVGVALALVECLRRTAAHVRQQERSAHG
jgi:hypothetical protein